MIVTDKCPGCGHAVDWDTEDQFWDGDKSVECNGCGATLYCFGTAPCCWRLELGVWCNDCGWNGSPSDYHACQLPYVDHDA